MKRWLPGLLSVLPLLLGVGCATTAMKGTPFFTGEYTKRQGPVEERVNLWPLLYYRDPALSVLWPVGERVKDEHFAVRPLFSVYNLDKPDGREWNVLWPLMQHDQASGYGRVFPLFWWGDDFFNIFPLYWHKARLDYLRDTLFPLWWYEREKESRELMLLLNLAGYESAQGRRSWWLFPLIGDLQRENGSRHRYQLWPLCHQIENASGDRRAGGVLPLWWYSETPERQRLFTLLWSQGMERGGDSWRLLLPLFWSASGADRESFYTLLGGYSAAGADRSWLMPLLLTGGRKTDDEKTTWLLGGLGRWSREGEEKHSHLFPLYAAARDDEGSRFYSLPWSHVERTDGSGWSLAPLYFENHYRDGHLTLSPFYASGSSRKAGDAWHAVLPLYYSADHADGHTFATLLGGRETRADGSRWTIFPLLSRVGARGGTNDWWLAAPLAHFRWDAAESRSHVFPLYYRDTATDTLISPLFAAWPGGGGQRTLVPPLLSWRSQTRDTDDWWLMGGLGHLSLGPKPGSSHFFPLYYQNPRKGLTLSPLYCRWTSQDGAARFFPPLLSGYASDEGGGSVWSLAGLYQHAWREQGKTSDWLLPLYAWQEDDYFYTLLAGHHRDGFTYYLTPLVSSWRNQEERGFRVFPLYARSHNATTAMTRTRFLWAVRRSSPDYARSVFFPLYGYTRHGSLSRPPAKSDGPVVGKEFLCLPFCWYDNVRRSQWTGADSNRTWAVSRERGHGVFPLWSAKVQEDAKLGRMEEHSFLWFLYDRRRETGAATPHEYVRHRVLWRLYHYEKLDGNVSMDVLPGITYDARTDGFRKTSFLWRVFRWERAPDGKRKLDLLFLPLLRD